MKIIVIAVIFLYHAFTAAVSDSFWNNATSIIIALTAGMVALGGLFIKVWTFLRSMKTEVQTIKKSIDGLLEQKTLADTALGKLKGIEEAAKEKAIGDDRELQIRKEQDLLHQTPPNSKPENTTSDVKEQIENAIDKQGDKIQKAVEEKGDEIKTEVPIITADKVVEKLDPKDKT